MLKHRLLLLLTLCLTSATSVSEETLADYQLYLIRHAEKQTTDIDPALTHCGLQRAKFLARYFSDKQIKTVYTTDYKRTQQTASAISQANELTLQEYDPGKLSELVTRVKNQQQSAVVVGHSNTTPNLAALIISDDVAPLSEEIYDTIYYIQVSGSETSLRVLKQDFSCQ
ncbi:histidine phosphatase family protein [Thalassotalea ponticola]|uniref:SixA phosphatase family protein n=1 Tax=Thalassotalea ponticola TaxID=1523392 RepID=UPI0025B30912|nr:histidine phosphatase family protein [Thalassotalea ponticola]MDN3653649.1 histidine phosphatase family protein [Thalassotalea ponticola]